MKNPGTETGDGNHKLIIVESLEDEYKLAATTVDIIEEAVANKVPVETQFKRFVETGARQG